MSAATGRRTDAEVAELRFHAGGARGRVRALRIAPLARKCLRAAVGAWLLLLLVGAAAAPRVIGGALGKREYRVLLAQRAQLGARLQSFVGHLEDLSGEASKIASRVARIANLYALRATSASEATVAPEPAGSKSPPPEDSIFDTAIAYANRLESRLSGSLGAAERGLAEIEAFERAHPDVVRSIPAGFPLRGERYVLSSGYGVRRSAYTQQMEFHDGIDFAAPVGTPVHASAPGVVVFAGTLGSDRKTAWWRVGRAVVLRHGDRYLTIYGHCETLTVAAGRRVAGGETIATVGQSGWTTGPNLHYAVWRRSAGGSWEPVDPHTVILDPRFEGEESVPSPVAALGASAVRPDPLPSAFVPR